MSESTAGSATSTRERTTEELLERAATATSEAERRRLVDEVVVLNLPVARALAARFRDRGEQLDDLVQVASASARVADGSTPDDFPW